MRKLGSHVSAAGGVDKAVGRASALDMGAFQLFSKNANQWKAKPLDPAVVERYKIALAESSITDVVVHDSYLINIASPDDTAWEKSIDALAIELDRCDTLGVPWLVSHPGAHMESGVDAGVARVAEAINRIHLEMPDGSSVIALETTAGQGTTLGRSFEELAQIIDQIDDKSRIAVCLDTCHVFAAGYDIRDKASYDTTMQAFDESIGLDYLKVIHLNDSMKPLGSNRDRHSHIGEGEIGEAAFGFFLNDPRLVDVPGILETPKDDDYTEDRMNLDRLISLYE